MRKNTVGLFYFFSAICSISMSFIAATYVIFLMSHGLNPFEVNMVNVAFFATMALCEIPTGTFADVFGRKPSFVVACLILAGSFFVYAGSSTFWGFVLAEAIGAVGKSFSNGAFQAWMVDRLKHQEGKTELGNVFDWKYRIDRTGAIFGGLAGAFLANYSVAFPWIAGGVSMIIVSILAIILMKEEYFVRKKCSAKVNLKESWQKVRRGIYFARTDNTAKFILVIGILSAFAVQAPNMQWQPLFRAGAHSQIGLGLISSGINIFLLFGLFLTGILQKIAKSEKRAIIISQLVIGVGIALSGLLSPWFWVAMASFYFHEMGRGAVVPINDTCLNEAITSKEERAIINSCSHMVQHLGALAGLFLSGYLAFRWGYSLTWIATGSVLVLGTLMVAKNGKQ